MPENSRSFIATKCCENMLLVRVLINISVRLRYIEPVQILYENTRAQQLTRTIRFI